MHIAFKFTYIHSNGLFTRLLYRIRELSSLPLSLHQEGTEYRIEASGDQAELERLAEQISSIVPQSLFLDSYKIEEIDRCESSDTLSSNNDAYEVPYCPECQEKVINTMDPFHPCSVCGFSEDSISMADLAEFTGIKSANEEAFFMQAADMLVERGEITLPTYNGLRCFSALRTDEQKDQGILFCDPTDISDKFLITQGELDILMTVEKPTVRLKPKLMFRSENEMGKPFYPVFFADDKITLALSTALKNIGIHAVYCDQVSTLRAATALDENMIIASGRDMLPWHTQMPLKQPTSCNYNGFQTYGDSSGLQLDKVLGATDRPTIAYVANHENSSAANAIRFEPAHAAMRSIVLEHGLRDKALCGIHFSRRNPSHIFSFSTKIGYTPLVLFRDNDLTQPKQMIEAIRSMDEGGMRLVTNFQKSFPDLYDMIEQVEFKSSTEISDIARIWSMAAVFIGMYEGDNALESCEKLESTAIEFSGKSGPRIDYKVISTDEGYQLDPRLAIRSAMSFKLAGLDDYLLSFGFIDSLADFIAEQAENADANIGIDGVTLSGGMFENRQLLMRAYNALSVNYPIYRNKRLSIDDANVALGAVTLGSE